MIGTTPAPAPTNEAVPNSAAAPSGDTQPGTMADDFMALLEQLVTASATASPQTAAATVDAAIGVDKDDEGDASDLANIIPIALPIPQLELPKDAVAANSQLDGSIEQIIGMLGKDEGTAQNSSSLVDVALASVTDADAKPADAPTTGPTVPFADALAAHRTASSAASDSTSQQAVNSPVGSPQWRDEVSAKVSLMVQQGNTSASLRLSPEHLGPLEVRISVQNDQASVWFGAAHADTRAAIEHALPRLREMFASQGLSLADTGVFREPPREQTKQSAFNSSSRGDGSFESQSVQTLAIRRLGLVDAYA
ncbi:MAG TPA: flagellar hook-length control protein FliK [Steroidobacteraceae bacterium]|nr:flagellar hook-length control protein FliK [Steroidobacteraceae bacterium]